MCCFRSISGSSNFRSSNKSRKRIIVWKVVDAWEGCIRSPYQQMKINYGWFKSNRRSAKLTSSEVSNISLHKGIHVLRTRKEAKNYISHHWGDGSSRKIVKCEACMKDFVACDSNQGELVFTKIWVPKPKKKKK